MAQGNDRAAQGLVDIQPTAIIEFFILYFNTLEKPDLFIPFHGGTILGKPIKWQGIDYLPVPVETEGFEISANGQLPRPKIRISNKEFFVTDLLLNNHDLQYAKLIRKRTFVKHLDDANFDGGNPWGEADATAEIGSDAYIISQKTSENKIFVEFELTSPLDLDNSYTNNRLILSRYCCWKYRGQGCRYAGLPIETENGEYLGASKEYLDNFSETLLWDVGMSIPSGSGVYLENNKVIVGEGQFAKTYYISQKNHVSSYENGPERDSSIWKRDGCGKTIKACSKRFQDTHAQLVPTGLTTTDSRFVFDQTNSDGSGILFDYSNLSISAIDLVNLCAQGAGHAFIASMWFKASRELDSSKKYPLINAIGNDPIPDQSFSTHALKGLNIYLHENKIVWPVGEKENNGTTNVSSTPVKILSVPYVPDRWTPFHVIVSGNKSIVDNNLLYDDFVIGEIEEAKIATSSDSDFIRVTQNQLTTPHRIYCRIYKNYNDYITFGGLHTWSPSGDSSSLYPLEKKSPIQIGAIAIVSGLAPSNYFSSFNGNASSPAPMPTKFSSLPSSTRTSQNLILWSDVSGISYVSDGLLSIETNKILSNTTLSGRSYSLPVETSSTQELYYSSPQSPQESMPFGGFPSTDLYAL